MNALVIEDNEGVRRSIGMILRPFVDNIRFAESMKDALTAIAEAGNIELITLDLSLPDSETDQTIANEIKHIRAVRPEAVLIVVTGQEIDNLENRVLSEGADGVIHKMESEFSIRGFLNLIATIVKKRLATPQNYQNSLELMERVTGKLAELSAA